MSHMHNSGPRRQTLQERRELAARDRRTRESAEKRARERNSRAIWGIDAADRAQAEARASELDELFAAGTATARRHAEVDARLAARIERQRNGQRFAEVVERSERNTPTSSTSLTESIVDALGDAHDETKED